MGDPTRLGSEGAIVVVERCREQAASPDFIRRWDALAVQASEPNPFYESWYLGPSLQRLDLHGEVVMLCVEADGNLLGLLPLVRQRSYYGYPIPHLRNWVHANCFCGTPLIARGAEAQVWQAILEWCENQAGWPMFLHLTHIAKGSVPERALAKYCEGHHPAFCVKSEERALLQSSASAEDYLLNSLSTKKRKELRRQHRRLGELGQLEFNRQTGEDQLEKWIAQFLALEAAGWKGEARSALAADPATESIFRESLLAASSLGKIERISLLLDSKPIAMLANFHSPPGAFSFKTTFDEDYARFSPGVLLQLENLALLDRPEVEWTDSCAEADHPMIDRIWRERRTIMRINVGLGGAARRAVFRQIAAREGGTPL